MRLLQRNSYAPTARAARIGSAAVCEPLEGRRLLATDLGTIVGRIGLTNVIPPDNAGGTLGQTVQVYEFEAAGSFIDVQLLTNGPFDNLDIDLQFIGAGGPTFIGSSANDGSSDESFRAPITGGRFSLGINTRSAVQFTTYGLQIAVDAAGGPFPATISAPMPTSWNRAEARDHGVLSETSTKTLRDFVGFLDGSDHISRDLHDLHVFEVPIAGRVTARIDQLAQVRAFGGTNVQVQVYRDVNNDGVFSSGERFNTTTLDDPADVFQINQTLIAGRYAIAMSHSNADGMGGVNYRSTFAFDAPDPAGNTLAAAKNIGTVGNNPIAHTDYLSSADTVDFFRLATVAGGPFVVGGEIGETAAGSRFEVDFLRDANGNGVVDGTDVIVSTTQAGNLPERFAAAFTAPGTYFMRVRRVAGEGKYTVGVSIRNTDLGGSTLATALSVSLLGDVRFTDSLSRTDTADIVRFAIDTPGTIHASLRPTATFAGGANASLQLIRDGNGNGAIDPEDVLATSANPANLSETIARASTPGTYFLRVSRASGSPTYTLNFHDDTAGNTVATARDFGTGGLDEFEFVGPDDAVDFYAFTVPAGGRLVGLFPGQLGEPINLTIARDSNSDGAISGTEIVLSNDISTSGATIRQNLPAGRHFIRVTALGPTGTAYGLLVASAPTENAGNTLAAARNIGTLRAAAQTFKDFVGDGPVDPLDDVFDVYRFTTGVNGPFELDAQLASAGGNADLELIRDLNGNRLVEGNEVIARSVNTGASDAIKRVLTVPGDYFLRVRRTTGNVTYTARFSAVSRDTAGNTPAAAQNLGALTQTTISSAFVGAIDRDDFYRFTIPAARSLAAQFAGTTPPPGALRIEVIRDTDNDNVIDANETIASTDTAADARDRINGLFLPAAGTYFVRVTTPGTDGDYELSLATSAQVPFPAAGPFQIRADATTTIQAEDFDKGGQGVAYNDTTNGNGGGVGRTDESVDFRTTSDVGGGFRIATTAVGEFLEYTVNVVTAASYDFDFRVSSNLPGATFHLEVDGVNATGTLAVPDTGGGFDSMTTITRPGVFLPAGPHVLRLAMTGTTGSDNGFAGSYNFICVRPTPGQTGTFALSPQHAVVRPGTRTTLGLEWTVPAGGWRTLKTIDLKVRHPSGKQGVLWVRFDEATNTVRLFDPDEGKFGPARALGSNGVLSTRFATVHLRTSRVIADGPLDDSVVLSLDVSFKPKVAGRRFIIEAAATDDLGHRDAFDLAGTLRVLKR